jgi:hypothetical protein
MGGVLLGIIVMAGVVGVACWERHGGRVPTFPDVRLPVHGMAALVVGLLLAVMAASIVALDLSLVWLRVH